MKCSLLLTRPIQLLLECFTVGSRTQCSLSSWYITQTYCSLLTCKNHSHTKLTNIRLCRSTFYCSNTRSSIRTVPEVV